MSLQVLPLAVTMMAGPQILSAIVLVTGERPVPVSLAFLSGVAIATTVGVSVMIGLAGVLGDEVSLGSSGESGSTGNVVQYALVALLVFGAIRNYVNRATVQPPKWLGSLQTADAKKALKTGLLLIGLMPSDLLVMMTVGVNLQQANAGVVDAIPFIVATVVIAALPLSAFVLFRRRAERAMPALRDWMTANAGIVNMVVCVIFIALIV